MDAEGKERFFAPDAGFNFNPGRDWAKPFTPPPLDTLPRTFAPGQALLELPRAERFDPARLLPTGLSEPDYFARFLAEFPAETVKTGVFMDVQGEPLPIGEDLFRDRRGAWKIKKHGREVYLPLLAEAIQRPDEIWMAWQPISAGGFSLRRRYVKIFVVAGDERPALAVFEEGTDGWEGVTVFSVDAETVKTFGFGSAEAYVQA